MNGLTIQNTKERVLISIDKNLINIESLTEIIRFLELETTAKQIDFNPELLSLGDTIKQEWWQQNKTRLLQPKS